MRTTIVPAQITTVEDTIAGNLNLTQILILMVPIFAIAIIYAVFPTPMQISVYKIVLSLIVTLLCILLSLRIKGMVVLNWLLVLTRFNTRPKLFVFNKNDTYLRTMHLPEIKKEILKPLIKVEKVLETNNPKEIDEERQFTATSLITKENLSLRFRLKKKGGLHVAFEPVRS